MAENERDGEEVEKQQEPLRPYERKAGNWLNAYMEYTKESESPDNYHIWIGLSCLASALKRNVWVDQGLYVLFPNLYVALVGPPGRTGKSTAMWRGRQILYQVPNIKVGPDSASREQLIRAMAESKFDNQCALTVHSSEFSSIVEVSGVQMIQFLTDIFDGNYTPSGGWRYETKTQGKDVLVNPVLNLLVGTTPSYFAESMPADIVGNGFTSRTIIVYEEKERLINPRPDATDGVIQRLLVEDLRHIAHLRGQFNWTDAAKAEYDKFYRSLYENPPQDHRMEGYHWRKKVHVLKVAMLLSVAENDSLVLEARDIVAAISFLESLEGRMARAFSAVGKYDHATDLERIGTQIRLAGGMPMAKVFSRNYFAGSHDELRRIIAGLSSMGLIRTTVIDGENYLVPTDVPLPWEV